MFPQMMALENSPTYRRSLAQRLEQEREAANNGTIPGGLASMINAGTAAYLRARDEGDRSKAQKALMGGITEATDIGEMGEDQIPAGPDGALYRLGQLEDNPYAGRLSQMLTFAQMERQREAEALAEQRAFQQQQTEAQRQFQLDILGRQQNFQRSMQRPPERRVITGPDGVPYYLDTGEPALPNAGPPPAKAPVVRTVKQPDGSEVAVQWDDASRSWVPMNAPQGGLRPEDQRRKLTENQSKLTLFKSNMAEVAPLLEQMEGIYNPANFGDAAARDLAPGLIENYLKSDEGQQYQTLASQWSEGALRIATGAAATQDEIDRTRATYFPRPGDSAETVALKRQMRAAYQRSIDAALGDNSSGNIEPPNSFAAKFAAQNRANGYQPRRDDGIGGVQPLDVPPSGSGIDPETWKFLTPEQRKLWK